MGGDHLPFEALVDRTSTLCQRREPPQKPCPVESIVVVSTNQHVPPAQDNYTTNKQLTEGSMSATVELRPELPSLHTAWWMEPQTRELEPSDAWSQNNNYGTYSSIGLPHVPQSERLI